MAEDVDRVRPHAPLGVIRRRGGGDGPWLTVPQPAARVRAAQLLSCAVEPNMA